MLITVAKDISLSIAFVRKTFDILTLIKNNSSIRSTKNYAVLVFIAQQRKCHQTDFQLE